MEKLKELQKQRDQLRALLQAMVRVSDFCAVFLEKSEELQKLDKEFSKLAQQEGAQVSKFGRLV